MVEVGLDEPVAEGHRRTRRWIVENYRLDHLRAYPFLRPVVAAPDATPATGTDHRNADDRGPPTIGPPHSAHSRGHQLARSRPSFTIVPALRTERAMRHRLAREFPQREHRNI